MPCQTVEAEVEPLIVVDPCADECIPQLDQVQMEEMYDLFDRKIRASLQVDLDCKKINGATYSDTWAKIMGPTITGIMQSMVSIATKETSADRCVKQAQCDLIQQQILEIVAKMLREDGLADTTNDLRIEQTAETVAKTAEIPIKSTREDGLALATNNLKGKQGLLYDRQAQGFDDNAFQKLFDSQMSNWSMVFADTELTEVVDPLNEVNICDSFARIKANMGDNTGCVAAPVVVSPTP